VRLWLRSLRVELLDHAAFLVLPSCTTHAAILILCHPQGHHLTTASNFRFAPASTSTTSTPHATSLCPSLPLLAVR
jgi:hypothetical protein